MAAKQVMVAEVMVAEVMVVEVMVVKQWKLQGYVAVRYVGCIGSRGMSESG